MLHQGQVLGFPGQRQHLLLASVRRVRDILWPQRREEGQAQHSLASQGDSLERRLGHGLCDGAGEVGQLLPALHNPDLGFRV